MKSYGRILWFVTLTVLSLTVAAYALRPSGPGINTKANSLSVAIATDQPSVPTHRSANTVTLVVPGLGTDYTALCKDGFVVANADAGTANVQATGQDAAVSLTGLGAMQYYPLALTRVLDSGTTATLYCLSH